EHQRLVTVVDHQGDCDPGQVNDVVLPTVAVGSLHVDQPQSHPTAVIDQPLTESLPCTMLVSHNTENKSVSRLDLDRCSGQDHRLWLMRCHSGWFPTSSGSWSSRCFHRLESARRAVGGHRRMHARCSPRSCMCSPAGVPGGGYRRRSGGKCPPRIDGFCDGPRPDCGPGSTGGARRAGQSRADRLVPGRGGCRRGADEKGGAMTGPNPVDRGKAGWRVLVLTGRGGLTGATGISAANTPDGFAVKHLVHAIPAIRCRRGPRRRKPGKLHGDKAYNSAERRVWLQRRGIVPRLARIGIETSQKLGRHRWVVERSIAWLAEIGRAHV